MIKISLLSTIAAVALSSQIAACQSLPYQIANATDQSTAVSANSATTPVSAVEFLGPHLMNSQYHRVEPTAQNNGITNVYTITTPDHQFRAVGIAQARQRIDEARAISNLRELSTFGAAAKSFKDRTTNLVTTPLRAIRGGKARYADAQAAQNNDPNRNNGPYSNTGMAALKTVSTGFGAVVGKLGNGVKELGATTARIATGVGGTKCSGLNCATKAGEDVWSGFNSLVGKHAAAKRMHNRMGTDPYSDNKVLQRHISRLAYAESYVGTGYKFGVSGAGIDVISPLATGVGYYNNTEFVAGYEDAHKARNVEKDQLRFWGLDKDTIRRVYKNKNLTHKNRSFMMNNFARIEDPMMRGKILDQLSHSTSRVQSNSILGMANYLSHLKASGAVQSFAPQTPLNVGVTNGGTIILPIYGDLVRWQGHTPMIAQNLSALVAAHPQYKTGELHILGKVDPSLRQHATKLGLGVKEITPIH